MEKNLIRLSEADNLLTKKSTLYRWSAKGVHPEIFIKLVGIVYVDLDKYNEVIESSRGHNNKEEVS